MAGRRGRMMDHDLIVIGGGAAGLGAVRAALWAGADVALVTDGAPGGDCTFTGCVPSKTLLAAARDGLDFAGAMARVRATVEHIAATESADVLRGEGATVIEGRGRLVTHDTVAVGDRRMTASRIVLATGSRPTVPDDIPGLAEAQPLTNETVFDLTQAPESLGIIGGGPTGCELAQAFALLGVHVTLFEYHQQLLPGEEPEAAATVRAALQAGGVRVLRCSRVAHIAPVRRDPDNGEQYSLVYRLARSQGIGGRVTVDRLLVAAGRTPVTDELGLTEMKLKLGEWSGHVLTDERLETSVKGVYAAGDVAAWRLQQRSRVRPLFTIDKIDTPHPPRRGPRGRTGGPANPTPTGAAVARAAREHSEQQRETQPSTARRLRLPRHALRRVRRPPERALPVQMRLLGAKPSAYPATGSRDRYTVRRTAAASARSQRRDRRMLARERALRGRQRQHHAALNLAHAADEMGRIAAGNALGKGLRGRFRASMVPRVVFTDPEVASVGVVPWHAPPGSRVAYMPLAEVDRAITDGRTDGFIAIVAGPRRLLRNAGGGRILGATIVAPRAGEMISEIVLAMRTGAFAGRLAQASHAYPTWSSGVQKAAAQFFGKIEGRQASRTP